MTKVDYLIETLLDKDASIADRDDAAMDLGDFDDEMALNALILVILDPTTEPFILDVCGESIAKIWVNKNKFDKQTYEKMPPAAKQEARDYINYHRPHWLKE